MPFYEYQCQSCGHLFEELQKISDEPLVTCPNCGKDELKKLISGGSGLIFKGSGFYLTDYKKTNSSASQGGKKSDEQKSIDSTKKSETSKDTKSGSKPKTNSQKKEK